MGWPMKVSTLRAPSLGIPVCDHPFVDSLEITTRPLISSAGVHPADMRHHPPDIPRIVAHTAIAITVRMIGGL